MLVRQVLPLFFAHSLENEPIEGRTRLQKMLFLLQQEYNSCDFQYQFHAYDYGPYSSTLQFDIDELIQQGLLKESTEGLSNGKLKYKYSITKEGSRLVEGVLKNPKNKKLQLKKIHQSCSQIKSYANRINLNDLLRDVYLRYPSYAKRSVYEF